MEAFDKVEELLLAEGYSKEEIPAIMVSLVEQGFDPWKLFLEEWLVENCWICLD